MVDIDRTNDNDMVVERREAVVASGADPVPPARTTEVTTDYEDDNRRGYSIGSPFLGWAVATFFTLVFAALIGGLIGATAVEDSQGLDAVEATNVGILASIGGLIALGLGYLLGGYAAGRMAGFDGLKHGAAVAIWGVAIALLVSVIPFVAGNAIDTNWFNYVGPAFFEQTTSPDDPFTGLTAAGILVAVLAVAVMFGAAILGGKWGERYTQPADRDVETHRRVHTARRI